MPRAEIPHGGFPPACSAIGYGTKKGAIVAPCFLAVAALRPASAARASAAAWTARSRAAGTPTGAIARPRVAWLVAIGVEAAGVGVVGREARGIAGVPVRPRCALRLSAARSTRPAIALCAESGPAVLATAGSRSTAAGALGSRATGALWLVAVRLARTARAIGIAMA